AAADLRGIGRLVRSLASGNGALSLGRPPGPASGPEAPEPSPLGRPPGPAELASFARIGLLSTVAWLLLWLALRPALGAFAAEGVALLLANGVVAFARFVLLRAWVFRGGPAQTTADVGRVRS